MGQKVNPHGLRVGVIKDWDSRWFVKKDKVRRHPRVRATTCANTLKKTLYAAGVPKIEIERDASQVRVHIHCAKPGIVIGKGGAEIEKLRQTCEKMLGKPTVINIVEVRSPDVNAQLVAENIAQQLEKKRISFRRAMKQAIGRAMKLGAKGIKTQVSGRLGGAEIARTEQYHEGTIPLQTLRADIDYGFAEATHHLRPHRREGVDLSRRGSRRPLQTRPGKEAASNAVAQRVKYRRVHRGRLTGKATRGTEVNYGEFGLVALEPRLD